jgi:hypothetical protein
MQSLSITDLWQSREFSSCDSDSCRNMQQFPGKRRDKSALAGPQAMQNIESSSSVFAVDCSQCRRNLCTVPTPSFTVSDIVDGRTQQGILVGVRILIECEDMHLMVAGKTLDEPKERRYDSLCSAAVKSARRHDSDFHVLSPFRSWQ